MIPVSLSWDTRNRWICLKWNGFFSSGWEKGKSMGAGAGTEQVKSTGGSGGAGGGGICVEAVAFLVVKEGEVSIINLRRMPAMVEAFFGKIPDRVEKAVNIVKGKKKGE